MRSLSSDSPAGGLDLGWQGPLNGDTPAEGRTPRPPDRHRVVGLDGLRGLAALYVCVHHCWLLTFKGYPANTGPAWLDWLVYGRLAVVFFLVLSGFSLAISAARHGWRVGSVIEFARRRAWRIVPPYWAALAFSLVIAWAVIPASRLGPPTARSVVVYGLLTQDVATAPTPNLAFWSIAVEAELYLILPLLVLIRRRLGAVWLLVCATLPVVLLGLLAPSGSLVEGSKGLALQLAPLFAAGVVSAGVLVASDRIRSLPWHWLAAGGAAPVLLLVLLKGPVWTVDHYFWIDLAVGPAMAMLLMAVATGRPTALVWLLGTRPVRSLGTFSYSLYLIHLPIIMIISRIFVARHIAPGLTAFWVTLTLGLPISLLAARLFAMLFEVPFVRYRSWSSLLSAVRTRGVRLHQPLAQQRPRGEHRSD
ncbi:MAG TPA: acyltransferase [Catenuloplanes sp.]|jgi:peptidoglycan/LPS O-acetylase OafA/YrhL